MVWKIIEKGMHHETDESTKDEIRQIYSSAAELYHKYRPKYPESIIDQAIAQSPRLKNIMEQNDQAQILEIGCGPGTMTLPLGRRGYQVTAFDPGVGMIKKAQEVCKDLPNVSFQTIPFKSFESDVQYDAIVAATSLHWAFTEAQQDSDDGSSSGRTSMIRKLESLLHDDGTLILLWNYPALPSSTTLLDNIADALNEPKPFCFGVGSIDELHSRMEEHVHIPLLESGLFEPFTTETVEIHEKTPIDDFINLMQTTSLYITMDPEEKKRVFGIVETIMKQDEDGGGEFIQTNRKLILDVTRKKK